MCASGSKVESTENFLFRCHLQYLQRLELFENLVKVDSCFLNLKVKEKVSFLLYGSQSATSNHDILKFVTKFVKETARLDTPLFCSNNDFLIFFSFFTLCGYLYICISVQILISCAAFIVSTCLMSLLNVESYVYFIIIIIIIISVLHYLLFSLILYSCLCR